MHDSVGSTETFETVFPSPFPPASKLSCLFAMAVSIAVILLSGGDWTAFLFGVAGVGFGLTYLFYRGTVKLKGDRIVVRTWIHTTIRCEAIEAVFASEPRLFKESLFMWLLRQIPKYDQMLKAIEGAAPQTLLVLAKRRLVLCLAPVPCLLFAKRLRLYLTSADEERLIGFWRSNLSAVGVTVSSEEVPNG